MIRFLKVLSIMGIVLQPLHAETYHWRNAVIGGTGFATGIVFHPTAKDVLYMRTDMGGAYRWIATSSSWEPITDMYGSADWNMLGIESIALDPQDPDIIYVAAGTYTNGWANNSSILRSHDRGNTWDRVVVTNSFLFGGNEDGRSMGERMVVDPNKGSILFLGTRRAGLWKSLDSAKTWTKVTSFPVSTTANNVGIGFVTFDPRTKNNANETQIIYAGVAQNGSSLYRSVDGGSTWNLVPGAPAGLMPHHAILASDGTLYSTWGDGPGPNGVTKGEVFKMNTSNDQWTNITPLTNTAANYGFGYAGLAVDAEHPQTVMVSTMDYWYPGDTPFRTTDGGATWKIIKSTTTRNASSTPFLRWGAANDANLGCGNWEGVMAIDPFNSNIVMYVTGATIWGTKGITNIDNGSSAEWTPFVKGFEQSAVEDLASPPSGADLISGIGDVGGFVHSNIDVSPASGMLNPRYTSGTSVDFAESKPNTIVRVGRGCDNTLGTCGSVSADGGTSWTTFAAAPGGARENGVVAISADGTTIVWSPGTTAAYYTTNQGGNWTACAGLNATGVSVIADRVNSQKFYAVVNGTLYASTDGAKTFTAKATGLSGAYLKAVPGYEGHLWLSGNNGIYRSTDGGTTFTKITTTGDIWHHGFGKAATGKIYPSIFVNGTVKNVTGIFRSDDEGATWVRANDDAHQWGGGSVVIGDPKVFGRFYLATNGRGIIVGDLAVPTSVRPKQDKSFGIVQEGSMLMSKLGTIQIFSINGNLSYQCGHSCDLSRILSGHYIAKSGNTTMPIFVSGLK